MELENRLFAKKIRCISIKLPPKKQDIAQRMSSQIK